MDPKVDEALVEVLSVVRSYGEALRVSNDASIETYLRAADQASDALISSPYSDDVKRALRAVFRITDENYLTAMRAFDARKKPRFAWLGEIAVSIANLFSLHIKRR